MRVTARNDRGSHIARPKRTMFTRKVHPNLPYARQTACRRAMDVRPQKTQMSSASELMTADANSDCRRLSRFRSRSGRQAGAARPFTRVTQAHRSARSHSLAAPNLTTASHSARESCAAAPRRGLYFTAPRHAIPSALLAIAGNSHGRNFLPAPATLSLLHQLRGVRHPRRSSRGGLVAWDEICIRLESQTYSSGRNCRRCFFSLERCFDWIRRSTAARDGRVFTRRRGGFSTLEIITRNRS
jgi:hypothetical protein